MSEDKKPEDNKQDEQKPGKDYEGGYGGGRNRAEKTPQHAFGERGFGGGRGSGDAAQPTSPSSADPETPEGAKPVPGGPGWQERYADENADKYGQAGGQPTAQRGPSQSTGGEEHEEADVGSTNEISPRGGVGIRETENWPEKSKGEKPKKP